MQTFRDLIIELEDLNTDDPEVADFYMASVEEKGVNLFQHYQRIGAGGCFERFYILDDFSERLPGDTIERRPAAPLEARDPRAITRDLRIVWSQIMRHVAEAYPDSFPTADHAGGFRVTDFSNENYTTIRREYSPADWQRRLADNRLVLDILHREAMREPPLPELTGTAAAFADYIIKNAGKQNDQIAYGCDSKPSYFRRVFCEKLRPRGYRNVPGEGYYGPNHPKAKSCSATK